VSGYGSLTRDGLLAAGEAELETLRERYTLLCTRGATDISPPMKARGRDSPGWGDRERTDGGISKVTVLVTCQGEGARTLLVAAEDWDEEHEQRACREPELRSMTCGNRTSDARRSVEWERERQELLRALSAARGRTSGRDPMAAKIRSFRA
jgi:hypothetical protein